MTSEISNIIKNLVHLNLDSTDILSASNEEKQSNGEVHTPKHLMKDMLDKMPKNFGQPKTQY